MTSHTITSREAWLAQRKQLLAKEKAFYRLKDELAEARRALPWVRVEKEYQFDAPAGRESLADLFGPHSQLIVYHFMFHPNAEVGCKNCSFFADHWRSAVPHLRERDVSLLAVSRAPLAKLDAFKQRHGWQFKWVSSAGADFNYDFEVSFHEAEHAAGRSTYNYAPLPATYPQDMPGFSVFKKDQDGTVFHTYSTFSRGIELANASYQLLDMVPSGRDEAALPYNMSWVKYGYDHAQRF
jgi:predicted dithiol-disulfide oxidoreductase (DUF899 family)